MEKFTARLIVIASVAKQSLCFSLIFRLYLTCMGLLRDFVPRNDMMQLPALNLRAAQYHAVCE